MVDTGSVLEAIQTLLTGDASLNAVVPATNIGTHLKDGTTFPHILWNLETDNAGIKGELAYSMTLVLDVWTEVRGVQQCWEIHDLLASVLDTTTLSVTGGSSPGLVFDTIDVDTESDGRTRHATITYMLMVTE